MSQETPEEYRERVKTILHVAIIELIGAEHDVSDPSKIDKAIHLANAIGVRLQWLFRNHVGR
jgi:hypothetical protein